MIYNLKLLDNSGLFKRNSSVFDCSILKFFAIIDYEVVSIDLKGENIFLDTFEAIFL